mmetsp:Transcript_79491/g.155548  ORF Transcript_79491/g.155548 Transcript_79491/m.155548 type:complete len:203 (+) Transcript_79491:147-755(+)
MRSSRNASLALLQNDEAIPVHASSSAAAADDDDDDDAVVRASAVCSSSSCANEAPPPPSPSPPLLRVPLPSPPVGTAPAGGKTLARAKVAARTSRYNPAMTSPPTARVSAFVAVAEISAGTLPTLVPPPSSSPSSPSSRVAVGMLPPPPLLLPLLAPTLLTLFAGTRPLATFLQKGHCTSPLPRSKLKCPPCSPKFEALGGC